MSDLQQIVYLKPSAAQELLIAEVERHVLALRELLVRGDENMKAWQLLNSVPFWAMDSPGISLARAQQREMVLHAIEPGEYAAYYADNPHERPFEEQYGCSVGEAMDLIPRFTEVRDWLKQCRVEDLAQSGGLPVDLAQLVDLSGNDGAMAAGLSTLAQVTVLDLNPACVERARGRGIHAAMVRDFRDPVVVTDGVSEFQMEFDVAVLFETLEHLEDPAAGLAAAARYAPMLWVSTPCGAVEGLDLPTWGTVERKGHLWSFTPDDFRRLLEDVGEVQFINLHADRTMVALVRVAS